MAQMAQIVAAGGNLSSQKVLPLYLFLDAAARIVAIQASTAGDVMVFPVAAIA